MRRDLSYLKDCPIAVLGAGAVGMTLAADCKLAGREVRLYSRTPKSLAYMDKTGIQMDGIQRNLYGFERSGRAHLDMYTTDMAAAVKDAKLILISTENVGVHIELSLMYDSETLVMYSCSCHSSNGDTTIQTLYNADGTLKLVSEKVSH